MLLGTLDEELKPYLKYSAALHAALLLTAFFMAGRRATSSSQVYRIDFIGPTSGIINRDLEASEAAKAAKPALTDAKVAPQVDRDSFLTRKKRRAPLPRPSILSGFKEQAPIKPPQTQAQTPSAQSGSGAGEASVSAEMPNFPYPWYIAQIRAALWSRWSSQMPGGEGQAMVEFSILRNGAITDLRIEESSGEKSYDNVALDSVEGAAPFAPLPRGFMETFLRVHVRFTSQ